MDDEPIVHQGVLALAVTYLWAKISGADAGSDEIHTVVNEPARQLVMTKTRMRSILVADAVGCRWEPLRQTPITAYRSLDGTSAHPDVDGLVPG